MELRHLRYFLAVAEQRSFTRAAEKVGIGQPPLSMQIKDLEAEIGGALFLRTSHGVELSEVGRVFLPHAQKAVDDAEQALRAAQQAASGEVGLLRMGFTSSAVFHPLVSHALQQFRERHRKLEISLSEGITEQLLADIAASQLDAAFVRIVTTRLNETKGAHAAIKRMMDSVFPAEMLRAVLRDSAEIDNAAANLMTVYEITGPATRTETHRRCRAYLDAVGTEVETLIRRSWPSHHDRLAREGLL